MSGTPRPPQLSPGDVVAGRFRIVERIGSGGFSVVYRAHQASNNRFVALKVLNTTASSDEKIVERFRREALFASHLSHPNTITLFDYGQTDEGLCFIAMEYLQGHDLAEVVQRGRPMDLKKVWWILEQCCYSLAEAHRLGLVHRDLKPENIFLVQQDTQQSVKVLDFGVSKAITKFGDAGTRTMAPLTQEGTVFGTPLYMAPEQAMAEPISAAVDVYALGHIAFEMITGQPAYAGGNTAMNVMLKQINEPALALPSPWDQTPFSALITKCTRKDPDERIADAAQLLEHLLHDAFLDYMRQSSRPRQSHSLPSISAGDAPGGTDMSVAGRRQPPDDIVEVYGPESAMLDAALAEVDQTSQMRLVVVRGNPNTGRGELVDAFVDGHRRRADLALADRHRRGAPDGARAGLIADLASVADTPTLHAELAALEELLGAEHPPSISDLGPVGASKRDSTPIGNLGAQREALFDQIAAVFRRVAQPGGLIWVIKDLETVDTLTLAFVDYLFNDLQARPAPVLILATVCPDDLMRRTGLLRYTRQLLQAQRPVARQISLDNTDAANTAQSMGARPSTFPIDAPTLNESADDTQPSADADARGGGPIELFDEIGAEPAGDAQLDASHVAFDTVMGYLAQLGDVIDDDLWTLARARILPAKFINLADFIVDQAVRFGIVDRRERAIHFSQPGFARKLRQGFDRWVEPVETHRALADLLSDYYEDPDREQLTRIVGHLCRAQAPYLAMNRLRRAGERAFGARDLDTAREYYLQLRQILDDVDQGRVVVGDGDGQQPDFDRADALVRLGEIHGALGEYGPAEDAIRAALDPQSAPGLLLSGRAYKTLGDLAASQTRYEGARSHYREARDRFDKADHRGACVAATGAMGHCAMMNGELSQAESLVGRALEHAEQLHNDVLQARLSRFMGQILSRQGRYGEARGHLERASAAFEHVESPREYAETLDELAIAVFAERDYEQACAHFRAALEVAVVHHRGDLPAALHRGVARALAAMGNLEAAANHLDQAWSAPAAGADQIQTARVRYLRGDICLAQQRPAAATDHYQRAEQIARQVGLTEFRADIAIRRSYLAFDAGQPAAAYQQLSQAMQRAESAGHTDAELQARAHIIYLQLREHQFQTRQDTFESLLAQARRRGLSRARVLCQIFKADVHLARGEADQASRLIEQARRDGAELGDYALFVGLHRRRALIDGLATDRVSGVGIGALVPPEVGLRACHPQRIGG